MTIDNQFIIIDREGNIFLEKKNESYLLNSFSINKTKKINNKMNETNKYSVWDMFNYLRLSS